jgi:hypothetical protein
MGPTDGHDLIDNLDPAQPDIGPGPTNPERIEPEPADPDITEAETSEPDGQPEGQADQHEPTDQSNSEPTSAEPINTTEPTEPTDTNWRTEDEAPPARSPDLIDNLDPADENATEPERAQPESAQPEITGPETDELEPEAGTEAQAERTEPTQPTDDGARQATAQKPDNLDPADENTIEPERVQPEHAEPDALTDQYGGTATTASMGPTENEADKLDSADVDPAPAEHDDTIPESNAAESERAETEPVESDESAPAVAPLNQAEGDAAKPGHTESELNPYRREIADQVPPYGQKGDKTTGVLDLSDGRVLPPQDSGYNGPALDMPKPRPGMDRTLVTHVEAHSVAAMREHGVKNATLYINREPCDFTHPASGKPWGCENALERMLRPDERLTIYGPNGYAKVFTGRQP